MARIAPTIVALLLIGGTAAAFAVTEHLKLERAPITAPRFTRDFSPVCECPSSTARLSLRFRRPETVDASIVDVEGEPVRSLARDLEVPRGVETFVWNGLDDAGELAPDGVYRLLLRLERERRTILVPTPVRLDTVAPRILELEHRPDTISPDGDGRADRLHVRYRSSEKVAARLLVDGMQVVRTLYRGARRAQTVQWLGSLPVPGEAELREPADAGQYEVTLVLTDRAGNEVREAFPIRVRYIELDAAEYTVVAGGALSFEVDTDARAFSWSLFPKGRRDRPILGEQATLDPVVSAVVPADAVPGRYRLRVEAEGHHDVAVVIVSEPGP